MIIVLSFVILILSKQFLLNKTAIGKINSKLSNVDISEPKFAINNNSNKINITAKEGNF